MKVADLTPGRPAYCESCGEHIKFGEIFMYHEAYISYAALVSENEFALLCQDCSKIQELLQSTEVPDWNSIELELREALEDLDSSL